MKTFTTQFAASLLLIVPLTFTGCTGDVETTDDSIQMEAEMPKVETGEEDVDLDPSTDDDVDVETPLEGDT